MRLAKDHLDVGLFTNNASAMLAFWQHEVGLPFEETLPTGGGTRQHRHAMNGSVLKLNDVRDPMEPAPAAGYRDLLIARAGIGEPQRLTDPDGNRVELVPPGSNGVEGIEMRLHVRNAAAFDDFYGRVCEFEGAGPRRYRCGDSLISFQEAADAPAEAELRGTGFRYLTVQVWDCDAEHRGLLERGATEGRPPLTLGTTARFSFIRDPDGNWIEISQRASLTGPLPS
jgi:catechol 2,3-dioxygenase-like lactoylglutathione lyase family enzyme